MSRLITFTNKQDKLLPNGGMRMSLLCSGRGGYLHQVTLLPLPSLSHNLLQYQGDFLLPGYETTVFAFTANFYCACVEMPMGVALKCCCYAHARSSVHIQ